MKRLLVLIFLLVASVSFGQTLVTPNDPLAPAGTVIRKVAGAPGVFAYDELASGGASLVSEIPFSSSLQAEVAAAPVPILVTNLATRVQITLTNKSDTDYIKISFNAVTASASASVGHILYPHGSMCLKLDPTKYVSIWASATIMVDVLQEGY